MNSSRWFPYCITTIFLLLGLYGITHHELWRDEFQPWLLGRDTHSIAELISASRYEGHPVMWHSILYVLSRISVDPFIMPIFHILLASATIFLFVRFSPFSLLQKTFFVFGYFFFYEYALISRDYVLGLFFLTLYFITYERKSSSYGLLALILFFLCNCNAMAFLVGCSLGLVLFGHPLLDALKQRSFPKISFIAPFVFFLMGVAMALAQLIPVADCALYPGISAREVYFDFNLERLSRVMSTAIAVYFPLQDWPSSYFWTSNLILASLKNILPAGLPLQLTIIILGFAIFLIAASFFLSRPKALGIFLCGTLVLWAFFYFKYYGGIRHSGHQFLLFVYCLWLSFSLKPQTMKGAFLNSISEWIEKRRMLLIALFAGFHCLAGVYAYAQDWLRPFTASRAAVEFLRTLNPKTEIIGAPDYALSPFSGYLNRPIYYLNSDRYGSYAKWDHHRVILDLPMTLDRIQKFMNDKTECILILGYNFPQALQENNLSANCNIQELARFEQTSIADEMYVIYSVKR
ncbi:MAG: hypothetical protein ACOY3I_06265 [Verrucomicrobiota bacterium]